MIEAVYFGTLIPLLFLVIVIKGEYRNLVLFFAWGLTSAIIVYLLNIVIDKYFVLDETIFLSQLIPGIEEFIKILPLLFLLKQGKRGDQFNIVRFAMASGIGFSILENYLYLSIVQGSGMAASITFIVTRSLTACLLHGSMTALIGYSIQVMRNYNFFSFTLFSGVFIVSATIHSMFNFFGLTEKLQVFGVVIPVFLFLTEYYLFNFFGWKRIPAENSKK